MNELISVTQNEQNEQIVSARELYDFLGFNKAVWSRWYETNIVNDNFFENGVDYIPLNIELNGNKTKDFHLKLDMAKELSMLARNDKGKQARKYFISCEKKLREVSLPSYQIEDPIKRAEKWIEEQKEKELLRLESEEMKQRAELNAPKVLFAESVSASVDSILIRELAKLISDSGINTGQNRLFEWLRENGYLLKTKNEPSQLSINQSLMELIERTVLTPNGTRIVKTTKVTGKGQIYFLAKYKNSMNMIVEKQQK